MTQRIFDIENEKDMADLWDILPEIVKRIEKDDVNSSGTLIPHPYNRYMGSAYCIGGCPYIKINWHDKTEITRPIQEATEADVGKLCYFWDYDDEDYSKRIGLLTRIYNNQEYTYTMSKGESFNHCRRLTKQEIEELC